MFDFKSKRYNANMQKILDAIASANERAFAAAEVKRMLASWTWDSGFSNTEVLGALSTIRARAREMEKNSPHFHKWIELVKSNVVGDGFRFKAQPGKVGDDTRVDEEAARFLEYHWWKWCENPNLCDTSRAQSFVQICQLAAANWARDGEAFLIFDRAAQNRYGFSVRIVRPDLCDETLNQTTGGDRYIVGGVEVDRATGAPVAYYFTARHADDAIQFADGKTRIRIPTADVVHLYTRNDAAQVRGIPLAHAALRELKMLEEFNTYELLAAKDESQNVGYFHAPSEAGAVKMMDERTANGIRDAVQASKKTVLPPGWSYETKTAQHPNREVTAFKNSMLRDVAAALVVEYAGFTNDGSVGFSAQIRAAMLAEQDNWKNMQRNFAKTLLDKVYYAWLHSILKLDISGRYGEDDFTRLEDHRFTGRRWGWIDPQRDVNAAVTAVAHGWKTDVCVAEEYGGDVMENIAEQARVNVAKQAAGLITVGNGLGSEAAAPAANDDEKATKE